MKTVESNTDHIMNEEIEKLNLDKKSSSSLSKKVRMSLFISFGVLAIGVTTIRATINDVLSKENNEDKNELLVKDNINSENHFSDDIFISSTPINKSAPANIDKSDIDFMPTRTTLENNDIYDVVMTEDNALTVTLKRETLEHSKYPMIWISGLDNDFFESLQLNPETMKSFGTRIDGALSNGEGTVLVMVKNIDFKNQTTNPLGTVAFQFSKDKNGETSVTKVNIEDISLSFNKLTPSQVITKIVQE